MTTDIFVLFRFSRAYVGKSMQRNSQQHATPVPPPIVIHIQRSADAVSDQDWFIANPTKTERIRPPSLDEQAMSGCMANAEVVVRKMSNGIMMRAIFDASQDQN